MKHIAYIIICSFLLWGNDRNPADTESRAGISGPLCSYDVAEAPGSCCISAGLSPDSDKKERTSSQGHVESHCCESLEDGMNRPEEDPDENHSCDEPCGSCPVNCHCSCHGHLTALQHHFHTIHCPYEAPFSYMVYRNNYQFDFHIPTFEPPRFG